MLKQLSQLLFRNPNNVVLKSARMSTAAKEKWDLYTAVCVERRPVITPQLNELEEQFKSLLKDVEYERSLKSDFEIKKELEIKQLEMLKKGDVDPDMDISLKQTTQDLIDSYTEELNKFKFAPRTTEADKSNDVKSLKRKLDKHLVLLMNQKIGGRNYYIFPQGLWQEGETLRQAAERVLKENCRGSIKTKIYGNAPVGLYKYKYPKSVQDEKGVCGAKVYIYFARHHSGQLPEKDCDYKWLDRNELGKVLPAEYHKSVRQFLINEN